MTNVSRQSTSKEEFWWKMHEGAWCSAPSLSVSLYYKSWGNFHRDNNYIASIIRLFWIFCKRQRSVFLHILHIRIRKKTKLLYIKAQRFIVQIIVKELHNSVSVLRLFDVQVTDRDWVWKFFSECGWASINYVCQIKHRGMVTQRKVKVSQ